MSPKKYLKNKKYLWLLGYVVIMVCLVYVLHGSDPETLMPSMWGVLIFVLISSVYLLPWLIASNGNHPSKTGIFVLNLFLGWTFLGWVIALVWAFTKPQQVIVYQNTPAQSGSLDINHPSEGLSDDLHNKTG